MSSTSPPGGSRRRQSRSSSMSMLTSSSSSSSAPGGTKMSAKANAGRRRRSNESSSSSCQSSSSKSSRRSSNSSNSNSRSSRTLLGKVDNILSDLSVAPSTSSSSSHQSQSSSSRRYQSQSQRSDRERTRSSSSRRRPRPRPSYTKTTTTTSTSTSTSTTTSVLDDDVESYFGGTCSGISLAACTSSGSTVSSVTMAVTTTSSSSMSGSSSTEPAWSWSWRKNRKSRRSANTKKTQSAAIKASTASMLPMHREKYGKGCDTSCESVGDTTGSIRRTITAKFNVGSWKSSLGRHNRRRHRSFRSAKFLGTALSLLSFGCFFLAAHPGSLDGLQANLPSAFRSVVARLGANTEDVIARRRELALAPPASDALPDQYIVTIKPWARAYVNFYSTHRRRLTQVDTNGSNAERDNDRDDDWEGESEDFGPEDLDVFDRSPPPVEDLYSMQRVANSKTAKKAANERKASSMMEEPDEELQRFPEPATKDLYIPVERRLQTSPTNSTSEAPTASPASKAPTPNPTTKTPTPAPTNSPTTKAPSKAPTPNPTPLPTSSPTANPTASPTANPTTSPTASPTASPTLNPTPSPTRMLSASPSAHHSSAPSVAHSSAPSVYHSSAPSIWHSDGPSASPTTLPSRSPSSTPSVSNMPSSEPSSVPSVSVMPTVSMAPSDSPTPMHDPACYEAITGTFYAEDKYGRCVRVTIPNSGETGYVHRTYDPVGYCGLGMDYPTTNIHNLGSFIRKQGHKYQFRNGDSAGCPAGARQTDVRIMKDSDIVPQFPYKYFFYEPDPCVFGMMITLPFCHRPWSTNEYYQYLGTEQAQFLLSTYGGSLISTFQRSAIGFTASLSPDEVAALGDDPIVEHVEANFKIRSRAIPQFNIREHTPQNWGLERISSKGYRNGNYVYYHDAKGVDMYFLDTGINEAHIEFEGRIGTGHTCIGNPGESGAHGTYVASLAAGSRSGTARKAIVHGVQVLDSQGEGTIDSFLCGVDFVIEQHMSKKFTDGGTAKTVANISFGSNGKSPVLDHAIERMIDAGISVVIAVGNNNADACNYSPYSTRAINVGSIDDLGIFNNTNPRSSFSNYGVCTDIFAPGTGLKGASNADNSASMIQDGTSAASGMAAGAVALYVSETGNEMDMLTEEAYTGQVRPNRVKRRVIEKADKGYMLNEGAGSPNRIMQTTSSPCKKDEHCPAGQTCMVDGTCFARPG